MDNPQIFDLILNFQDFNCNLGHLEELCNLSNKQKHDRLAEQVTALSVEYPMNENKSIAIENKIFTDNQMILVICDDDGNELAPISESYKKQFASDSSESNIIEMLSTNRKHINSFRKELYKLL